VKLGSKEFVRELHILVY